AQLQAQDPLQAQLQAQDPLQAHGQAHGQGQGARSLIGVARARRRCIIERMRFVAPVVVCLACSADGSAKEPPTPTSRATAAALASLAGADWPAVVAAERVLETDRRGALASVV